MEKLYDIRKDIDAIDEKIVKLLLKRFGLIDAVSDIKIKNNLPVYDHERESKILQQHKRYAKDDTQRRIIEDFFTHLMFLAKKHQTEIIQINSPSTVTIGYLGAKGSFSYKAAKNAFSSGKYVPKKTFESIFKSVKSKELDYGVLPIENTSTGSILEIYDLLRKYKLNIVGEKIVEIKHHLMANKGTQLEMIKKVYSHEQALMQSKDFLEKFQWDLINKFDTSNSAKYVSGLDTKDTACIASDEAAKIYGLEIIKKNINFNKKNYTRFIVISSKKQTYETHDKVTLGLSVEHKPGSLYDVLSVFNNHCINLLNLQSRPLINKPFEYYFYIDLESNISSVNLKKVVDQLKEKSCDVFIFGQYKADNQKAYNKNFIN